MQNDKQILQIKDLGSVFNGAELIGKTEEADTDLPWGSSTGLKAKAALISGAH